MDVLLLANHIKFEGDSGIAGFRPGGSLKCLPALRAPSFLASEAAALGAYVPIIRLGVNLRFCRSDICCERQSQIDGISQPKEALNGQKDSIS